MKNKNFKLSAQLNYTPILKISSKNMNKCPSFRLFGEVNFAIIANRLPRYGQFSSFLVVFPLVSTFTYPLILSYILQRRCSLAFLLY